MREGIGCRVDVGNEGAGAGWVPWSVKPQTGPGKQRGLHHWQGLGGCGDKGVGI